MSDLLHAALLLAERGRPVFACGADKAPLVPGGFKAASADPCAVRRMFCHPAAALIGMPTGRSSGLVVVDLDVKGSSNGLRWLDANRPRLPPTRMHKTRSGGLHLIFRNPSDVEVRNSAGRIAPGVDVRGEGGYIVVPPSPGYRVICGVLPAPMPDWLIAACLPPPPPPPPPPLLCAAGAGLDAAARRLLGLARRVATAGEGTRNNLLYWAVHRVLDAGIPAREAVAVLEQAALVAGLPSVEVQRTIASAMRRVAA